LIHSADPYSEALTKELRTHAASRGDVTFLEFPFDPAGTPDFRPALERAKAQGAQALIVFGLPPGIKSLVGQLAAAGWNRPVIGGVNINLTLDDFNKAGLKGGLWLVETESMRGELPHDGEAHQFREAYRAKFGDVPPFHALYLADAFYFVAAAHRENPQRELSELDRMGGVRQFQSASGLIQVNKDGTLRYEMRARKVR
ncbi:MAG: ABC transporter substrate-binding protein, partial [Gemmataceae bacterium]